MIRELHFPTPIYIADIKHPTLNQELERDIIAWSKQDKGITRTNVQGWHSTTNMAELPQFKKDTVEFERYLIGSANECDIDSEGRIMIPNIFRKSLKITKTVVFVGMLARFEIWSEKSWSKVSKTGFKKFQKSREVIDAI